MARKELDGGRLVDYKYDHDRCTNKNHGKTDKRTVTARIVDGLVKVSCLPANDEFIVEFDAGDKRVEVGDVAALRGELEPYNPRDLATGGTVIGKFGTGSGGVPEVRVCLSSEGTSDDECATWGYQWMTGSVVGNVGTSSGHKLELTPTTVNHMKDTTYTGKSKTNGVYSFKGYQDGVYDIQAFSTTKYRVIGKDTIQEVFFYHDETTDDGDTATKYVGTAGADTAKWLTRQLGLKIMGYIGHDDDGNGKLRGEETDDGISVKLTAVGTSMSTTTDENGFYKFEGLEDGVSYRVTASSSTYQIAKSYSKTRAVTPDYS